MKTETYAGRKFSVRALKGEHWGRAEVKLNGLVLRRPRSTDLDRTLADMKREIDEIDAWTAVHGIDGDRWTAEYFVPGTFEMCSLGIHPRDIGGACKHSWCVKHRCQWNAPTDEEPDSEQCCDTSIDDETLCQTHADLNADLMDAYADSFAGYQS